MIGRCLILCLLGLAPLASGATILEERLLQLENLILKQGDLLEHQSKEIEKLKVENEFLKRQVSGLESKLDELIKETTDDLVEDSQIEITHDKESDVNEENEAEIEVPKKRSEAVKADMDRALRQILPGLAETSVIAFYAVLTGTPCLKDNSIIVFDKEVTDRGNGYNTGDGIYIVPASGTYVFTWTTASRDDWYVSELIVNGNRIANAFTDTGNESNASQASGTAVITVTKGDHVFIRKNIGNGCNIHDGSYRLTSFAGWRLFE